MVKCPKCNSSNTTILPNKVFNLKSMIYLGIAFVGLYAVSLYMKANIAEVVLPAIIIYFGALVGTLIFNRNTRAVKCNDCRKLWRQRFKFK